MTNLVCLLEEPSAKEMLIAILPKILPPTVNVRYIVFEGKQDLEKHLERRIRGWLIPDTCFLVMRDQDSGDCVKIKNNLLATILRTEKCQQTTVRIACHELESFYLGDLQAVEQGLKLKKISTYQQQSKYRTPDSLANPAEELNKLSGNTYQKIQGSRAIAPHLKIDGSNTSHSFQVLISGIQKLIIE
ncbi:MAG: DUF4276 family protein [Candidatus Riflebacteria bacterium]|nr:DUF4276 family protein [Candidatus Riflebacteria bacterium]